jgi:type II secretory pathway pseudopilin PulG
MMDANDNNRMSLRGQAGYAMAALLVALAVMAVLMSVALPVWRHEAQREKEDELVWRGQQYVRAIRMFQAKTRGFPPSQDILLQGHYLRKKYKDPITNDDFDLIPAAGSPGQVGQPGRGGQPGQVGAPASTSQSATGGFGSSIGGTVPGGMIGVRSKSKAESIRLYQGRNHYNEWAFIYVSQTPGGPGGPGGRGTGPGNGRGGPGNGRGGPGNGRGGPGPAGGGPGRGDGTGPGRGFQPPPGFPGAGRGRGGG